MVLTLILSGIMMAGLFLLLLAGVGFVQDKRFFSSAPKEALAVIQPKEKRFPGQHVLGWLLGGLSIVMMIGTVVYGGWDGIRNGFAFGQFFARFVVMLLLLKAFDILFFDWFLLCRSNFFAHFFPEVKGIYGPHLFGYNKKSHLVQSLLFIVGSAVLAWICTLI